MSEQDDFVAPTLEGRYVKLRPVGPDDYRQLRRIDLGSLNSARWRFRGAVPSHEEWVRSMWQGCLAAFLVVENTEKQTPLGLPWCTEPTSKMVTPRSQSSASTFKGSRRW
jgi:hypothetical protein